MDTQEEAKVDPVVDTNEETKTVEEETKEETTEEKVEKTEEEIWQEKFQNQSSSAQRKITEANDELYSVHLKLAEKDQKHLIELAEGDEKKLKMAKRIAKEVFSTPLDQVLTELRSDAETPEQMESRLRVSATREANREASKIVFTKANPVLDETSTTYNAETKAKFDEKVERLMGTGIVTLEETAEILNDAFHLVSRTHGNPAQTQEQIAAAGSGGGSSALYTPSNQGVKEVESELAEYGITISDEAKKLVQQGKL